MTDTPTDEALENLFVEETGFATDDFPAAIFDFARAVLAKWGQPAQEPATVPRFNCWSTNEGDSWFDHPADSQAIYDCLGNDAKVGDEYELTAGWKSVTARYRITEVVGDGEEYEVECISHPHENSAPQPSPSAQAAESAVLKAIHEANMQLVRTGDDAFMLVPYKVATAQAADSVQENADRLKEAVGLLEELAEHDSYSTEYDGQMIAICPDCGEQEGEHRHSCAFVRAKAYLAARKQGATQ